MPHSAHAVAVHLLGGGALSNATVGVTAPYTGTGNPLAYGGGMIFEFRMFSKLSLETGAYLMPRGFTEAFAVPVQVSFSTLQFPLLLRFYFVPGLSLGVGPYYTYGYGTYTLSSAGATTTSGYNNFTFNAEDVGLQVSLAMQFPIVSHVIALVMRGQVLYGISNISQLSSVTTTLYDMQFFGGIKLGGF